MFNIFKNHSNKINNWKEKAKRRRIENDNLIKRNKELEKSRNKWKSKADKYQKDNKSLSNLLKKNF